MDKSRLFERRARCGPQSERVFASASVDLDDGPRDK